MDGKRENPSGREETDGLPKREVSISQEALFPQYLYRKPTEETETKKAEQRFRPLFGICVVSLFAKDFVTQFKTALF